MNTQEPTISTPRDIAVNIDGKTFTIRKLKFGGQIELANVIAQVLKGVNLKSNETNEEGKRTFNIDIGTILSQSPDKLAKIVAIGLQVDESVVKQFDNEDEVLEALGKILEINPVDKIMGKSTALLSNIGLY